MKNFLVILSVLFAFSFFSCKKSVEYKVVTDRSVATSDFSSGLVGLSESELNELGQEGWELISTYTTLETVHPNYGNKDYVTGLQPNTRTHTVVYIFKR